MSASTIRRTHAAIFQIPRLAAALVALLFCAGATPEAAWEAWMHSSAHRTHLLASSSFYRDQTNFGIGSYADPSSPFRRYWVVITAPPSPGDGPGFVTRSRAKPVRIAVALPPRS